jgi:hypothetical protein
MRQNHYTADGPRIQSSSVPDRGPDSFNEWHEDMNFERDLERILEDFKYQLREKLRTAYYNNTRSQSVTSSDHQRIPQS